MPSQDQFLVRQLRQFQEAKDGKRVVVSQWFLGLWAMQVCAVADATDEEILEVCNAENPAGISNKWNVVVRDPSKHDMNAESKPGPCEELTGRIHFVVLC